MRQGLSIYPVEVHRAHCNDAIMEYVPFNRRFAYSLKGKRDCLFDEGANVLLFDHEDGLSKEYRTVWGGFRSDNIMANTQNDGISGAIQRITGVRKPEIVGLHEVLIWNQYNMPHGVILDLEDWRGEFRRKFRLALVDKDPSEMRNDWVKVRLTKLRERSRRQIIQAGKDVGTRVRHNLCRYKPKPGELLAVGKAARGVCDMTNPGSSVIGYLMDTVKNVFKQNYYWKGFNIKFCKSGNLDDIGQVFEDILNPADLGTFYYHSDDSIISCRCADGLFKANLDISKCDGSNYSPIFYWLQTAMMADTRIYQDVIDAFEQLKLPFKVHSTDFSQGVKFTPLPFYGDDDSHVLYSGSGLTTCQNNMCNLVIVLNFIRWFKPTMTKAQVAAIIPVAASEVGFILKVDICEEVEDLQFLKYSPTLVEDKVVPWLNIGVWLRGWMTCRGDLPGSSKMKLSERAQHYSSEIVRGRCHAGNHLIHESFKTKIVKHTPKNLSEAINKQLDKDRITVVSSYTEWIPLFSLAKRYKVTEVQLEELCECIRLMSFGTRCELDVVDSIMSKDYGY